MSKEFDDFKKEINLLIEGIAKDAEKFYKNGNKAAGIRLRKGYKGIKQYVHQVSNETLNKKEEQ